MNADLATCFNPRHACFGNDSNLLFYYRWGALHVIHLPNLQSTRIYEMESPPVSILVHGNDLLIQLEMAAMRDTRPIVMLRYDPVTRTARLLWRRVDARKASANMRHCILHISNLSPINHVLVEWETGKATHALPVDAWPQPHEHGIVYCLGRGPLVFYSYQALGVPHTLDGYQSRADDVLVHMETGCTHALWPPFLPLHTCKPQALDLTRNSVDHRFNLYRTLGYKMIVEDLQWQERRRQSNTWLLAGSASQPRSGWPGLSRELVVWMLHTF